MSGLRWEQFEALEGDPRENWELVCREVVRRHYDRFGSLLTRKQHPGIEFHLTLLKEASDLGRCGDKWGWQCKWYSREGLRQDGNLRADQRRSIEESIQRTAQYVEDLTDWVLWTREKLSAADLRWFEALSAPFTLRHWDAETLAGLLSGPAESLRATWFGELVIDRELLTERRSEALAPIQQRYVAELHVRTDPEAEIDEILLGPGYEEELARAQEEVSVGLDELALCREDLEQEGSGQLHRQATESAMQLLDALEDLPDSAQGRLPTAEEVEVIEATAADLQAVLDRLADAIDRRRPSAAWIREAGADAQSARRFLARLRQGLRTPLIAVLGSAGAGKTHMAASISGPDDDARGVLLLGRQFGAKIADDDLARHAGLGANREELLEALEAVGMREGRRVPLVIDGINESDDPSAWQIPIARLKSRLAKLEHVFGLVTLRPTYRNMALPTDLPTVELPGLVGYEQEAMRRYLDYYKIDASPEALAWWRPSDPLLLSIFCRTVNPTRDTHVAAGELPASLTDVFQAYLCGVCRQISTTMKVPEEEIEGALLGLAWCFYREGARELDRDLVSEVLGDGKRAKWKDSLRFHLESEEILIRDIVEGRERVLWNYDLLAGYVIARNLLQRYDLSDFRTAEVREPLNQHPLREDIVNGLVGILGPDSAMLLTAFAGRPHLIFDVVQANVYLPADQVGELTLQELRQLFEQRSEDVLEAISRAVLRPEHPLNGRVLDYLLRDLPVWGRDLAWTDWLDRRSNQSALVDRLSERWRLGEGSTDDDAAVAWLSWVLSTSKESLKHSAIQALYRVGKLRPKVLFNRTLEMLDVNDPSIGEGMLAAAYGVAMANQRPTAENREILIQFADDLRNRLWRSGNTQVNSHWLVREYAYRIVQLASWVSEGEFDAPAAASQPRMAPPGQAPRVQMDDDDHKKLEALLGDAFIEEHASAFFESPDEQVLRRLAEEAYDRAVELGWSMDRFELREQDPEALEGLLDPPATEGQSQFANKYASAGFYEAVGRAYDRGEFTRASGGRLLEPPLDPSFPFSAPVPDMEIKSSLDISQWFAPADEDLWLATPLSELLRTTLYGPTFEGGDWIAIDGQFTASNADGRRLDCEIRGMLALDDWTHAATRLGELTTGPRVAAEDHGCFAGEAPWSPTYDSASTCPNGKVQPHVVELGPAGNGARVELLSVPFDWRLGRSPFNTASIGNLPAKSLALHLNLRKVPDQPLFTDPHGDLACVPVSFRGWKGVGGHLLFLRADLLQEFSADRGGDWGWLLISNRNTKGDGARNTRETLSLDAMSVEHRA